MKDIVIKKTSDESKRIVLQTDSDSLDYQSRFTIMTISGSIDGLNIPFRVGSVTSLYEISQFLADNGDASISIDVMSQDIEPQVVEPAVPKILKADFYAITDESSYKNYVKRDYIKQYSFEDSEPFLPWLKMVVEKSVKDTPFDIEISHNGVPCTFGGNTADFGQVEGTKMTIENYTDLMFDCDVDLGVNNPKGVWKIKITMESDVAIREVVIS